MSWKIWSPAPSLRRLLALFVCLLCLRVATAAEAADRAVITAISTSAEKAVITLSAPSVFPQVSLTADRQPRLPPRCSVDISPAVVGKQVGSSLDIHNGMIERIRTGQFRPDTARVVFELTTAQACRVQPYTKPDRLEIMVGSAEEALPPSRRAELATLPDASSPAAGQGEPATPQPVGGGAATLGTQGPVIPLEEAYHLAVQNEERIKIASHELGKAHLLPWRAITQLTPRGDIQGIYTRNKEEISFVQQGQGNAGTEGGESVFSGASTIRPLERWTGIFRITQPILEPGFFASRKLGKAAVHENTERYEFTVREVLFGVARAYYSVLRAQAQIAAAEDTLALSRDEQRQAEVRFRVGEVTKTDVLRSEVAVERAERQLVTDRNQLRLAFTTLARTVGVPEPLGVMEPKPAIYTPVPYEQLLEQAYAQRQDLRAQEFALAGAEQRKNLVLARYFPRVNARWEFPRLDAETFAERDKFWALFLNFEVPLFDGGARELDLMEQNENVSQAKLRVAQLRKDIQVEVKDALVTVETLGSTLQTLEKEVDLAQENYDITSKQYRVGLATSLDLNTSLNALNQVRTQLIDQTYAYQVALLRLQQTTGVFAQDYLPMSR